MNLQEHIRRILREETDELGERTKLEKLIAKQFLKPGSYLEDVLLEPDNYYGVVADIYNTDYGKRCHITVLMKKPFSSEDSDMLHKILKKGRQFVIDMFSSYFDDGISSSVSTIDSYKNSKWFYDERKNITEELIRRTLKEESKKYIWIDKFITSLIKPEGGHKEGYNPETSRFDITDNNDNLIATIFYNKRSEAMEVMIDESIWNSVSEMFSMETWDEVNDSLVKWFQDNYDGLEDIYEVVTFDNAEYAY